MAVIKSDRAWSGKPTAGLRRGVFGSLLLSALCLGQAVPTILLSHAEDYGFMWWAYGWRGRSPEDHRVFCVQTNYYGFDFDVEESSFRHLGRILQAESAQHAVTESNDVVFRLPAVRLETSVEIDGRHYRVASAAPKLDEVRIVEHGRFFQRIEILNLRLEDEAGRRTDQVTARYELACWPDRVAIILHFTCEKSMMIGASMSLLSRDGKIEWRQEPARGRSAVVSRDGQAEFALLTAAGALLGPRDTPQTIASVRGPARWCEIGYPQTLPLILLFPGEQDSVALDRRIEHELAPREDVAVRAQGKSPYTHPLESMYDAERGYYRVRLGDISADGWTPARDPDRLERVALSLQNPTDVSCRVRICFASPGKDKLQGIIGLSPMLRDAEGNPIGLPVQISKNWHERDWFNGSTVLELPAQSSTPLELAIAYARWGGVPAVSHAQLCLIGWGVNQLWHEVAIGSFGESICYDPDVNLNRSMIDDVRPLMVRPMGRHGKGELLSWTNNVGGGDFLVYFDESGKQQFLSRMRTTYDRYCPNLAEVTYAGQTQDGRIDIRITVQHYRSDDITRGLYHLRYDVKEPAPFQRLAFFQLGADRYNDHQFRTIAQGDLAGVREEWKPTLKGTGYARRGIECAGTTPWFSLHDAIPDPKQPGAWANRGIAIRSWRARLGGREIKSPTAGLYHTSDHLPSVLLELTPPPDLNALEAGDFVESDIDLLVLPMAEGDYLGPNIALREALAKDANTWRMVWREAAGNNLTVEASRGTVEQVYPTRIRCDDSGEARFSIHSGLGYLPITLAGVRDYRQCKLEQQDGDGWRGVDQTIHGNDFWQADYSPGKRTWDLTFNIPSDRADSNTPLMFRFASLSHSSENNVVATQPVR